MILYFSSILLNSTADSTVLFYVSLYEMNCIKIQTMSLILNLHKQRFFILYLLGCHHSLATEVKTCGLAQ